MKITITSVSVSALLLFGTSHTALAQACSETGGTYTCDGTGSGVDNSSGDDFTVNIGETGVIDSGSEGVRLDNRNTITNNGTIQDISEGIQVDNDNTITNNNIIDVNREGILIRDNNVIVNNGTISAREEGITDEADNSDGDNNTITNNGTISSEEDEGIELDDENTITNSESGIITAYGEGIDVDDRNTITNAGTITSMDNNGIEADDDNTITNSGTITASEYGLEIDDNNMVTNDGTITSTGGNGIRADDSNTIINNGAIVSETQNGILLSGDDNTITNSGSITGIRGIFSRDAGRPTRDNTTVVNNGTITGTDEAAIVFTTNGSDSITNNGILIGGDGTAVRMGAGSDEFIWQSNSQVTGIIEMGGGRDSLNVESADVIGVTRFNNLERFTIEEGSAAIVVQVGRNDYDLYTGSPTMLASAGQMVGGLTHDLTRRLLNTNNGPALDASVAKGDAGAPSNNWWVSGNVTFQRDQGQGFTQTAQNITVGKALSGFDVFFGLENAEAKLSDNTQSVDQQMLYAGISKAFQINPNTEILGLALLGSTRSDYNSVGGSESGKGTFGSVSARVNYHTASEFIWGSYIGYASLNTDAISTASGVGFSSQSSDTKFWGLDLRMPSVVHKNGVAVSATLGMGRVSGSADSVVMSAGGQTTTVAGTSSNQTFASAGVDISKDKWQGSINVRFDAGNNATLDLGFKTSF